MTTAINLQELEHELTRTKAMFEQWSGSMITRAQGCKAAHVAKMRAGKGELDTLNERFQRAEKQAAQVRQQMAQDAEHEQTLQERSDMLLAEQSALQKRLKQLQQEIELEEDAARQLAAEVTRKRADYELRIGKLDELHNTYQDSLGLKLISQDGELYLEFTHIDQSNPTRSFGFAVQVVGEDDEYRVTRCKPEVESRQQLERVLLIEHRDFAGFVRAMRQQFKQLVEAGH